MHLLHRYETLVPFIALMCVWLLAGRAIAALWPFYRQLTERHPGVRFESLDGLRGILALSVLFCHAVVTHHFFRTGQWSAPPWVVARLAGDTAVTLFFMTTGFLFWSKALGARGRVNAIDLYRGRVLRLAPMYLFCAIAILFVALGAVGPPRAYDRHFFISITKLFSLGLSGSGKLNGVLFTDFNAIVTWTLAYEWRFYLLLPLIAFFATPARLVLLAIAYVAIASLRGGIEFATGPGLIFFFGMLAAHLVHHFHGRASWKRTLESPLAAGISLVMLLALPSSVAGGYTLLAYLLTFPTFLCCVFGNDFFHLLRWRGAKMPGFASYSIYLTHGIVLYVTRPWLARSASSTSLPDAREWIAFAGLGVVVVLLSAGTYRWVEHPFMMLEQHFKERAKRRLLDEGRKHEAKSLGIPTPAGTTTGERLF